MDTALLRADRSTNRFRLTNAGVFGSLAAAVAAAVVFGAMVPTWDFDEAGPMLSVLVFPSLTVVLGFPAVLLTAGVHRLRPRWLDTGSWALVAASSLVGTVTGVLLGRWLESAGETSATAVTWWGVGAGAAAGLAGCVGVRLLNARRAVVVAGSSD